MGLFGKKAVNQSEGLQISGEQLCTLLRKAIEQAASEIESRSYITGPEIMFEYQNGIHSAGVRYDKKRAKHEKLTAFSKELATVYIDNKEFATPEMAYANADVNGVKLSDISEGIIVFPEYADLLQK